MSDYYNYNFLNEAELPDPGNDKNLVDCPDCGSLYNLPGRRRGPTLLIFTSNLYQVVCLGCYYHGRPANNLQDATSYWNASNSSGLLFHRKRLGLTHKELAELTGLRITTIQRIEDKRSGGSKYSRKLLAQALGVAMKDV